MLSAGLAEGSLRTERASGQKGALGQNRGLGAERGFLEALKG